MLRLAAFLVPLLVHDAAAATRRQRLYALRHGQSLANVEGVISSDPEVATVKHGLSEKGWAEAEAAAAAVVREAINCGCGVCICTSDFKRARQTALAVRMGAIAAGLRVWPKDGVLEDVRLRERYFGEFDGKGDDGYAQIWAADAISADHEEFGVESVSSVLERAYAVIERLDLEPALESSKPWYERNQPSPSGAVPTPARVHAAQAHRHRGAWRRAADLANALRWGRATAPPQPRAPADGHSTEPALGW